MALPTSAPTVEPAAFGRFDRILAVHGVVEVAVRVVSGHINISAADVAQVEIRAVARARPGRVPAGELERRIRALQAQPPIEQRGNIIKVGNLAGREVERQLSISYDLLVPFVTRLVCRAWSGSIAVEGTVGSLDAATDCGAINVTDVRGDVHAAVGAGEIEIQSVRGRVTLSTASGPILAGHLTGPLRAASGSGSVTVEHAATDDLQVTTGSGSIDLRDVGGTIRAASSSGSIDVEGRPGEGAWTLVSASGNLTVRLPPDAGFDLRARTVSGSLETRRPVASLFLARQARGRAGDGALRLELATLTGDIHIE